MFSINSTFSIYQLPQIFDRKKKISRNTSPSYIKKKETLQVFVDSKHRFFKESITSDDRDKLLNSRLYLAPISVTVFVTSTNEECDHFSKHVFFDNFLKRNKVNLEFALRT